MIALGDFPLERLDRLYAKKRGAWASGRGCQAERYQFRIAEPLAVTLDGRRLILGTAHREFASGEVSEVDGHRVRIVPADNDAMRAVYSPEPRQAEPTADTSCSSDHRRRPSRRPAGKAADQTKDHLAADPTP